MAIIFQTDFDYPLCYLYIQVSAKALLETYEVFKNATVASGVIGFNVNVANILAAVFIAAGQDAACVAESASSQLFISPARRDEILSQGDVVFFLLDTF